VARGHPRGEDCGDFQSPLAGRTVIDVKGLVIAPGFIDLHQHGQTPENYRFKARDGVTTALEMEVGASLVASVVSRTRREGADPLRRHRG
jgi:N-acyl-D-aspartate/D-glutamate deacylase